MTSYAL